MISSRATFLSFEIKKWRDLWEVSELGYSYAISLSKFGVASMEDVIVELTSKASETPRSGTF